MSTLYKMIFNPRSPFAFLLAFIYTILAVIGLLDPYKDFPKPDYPEGPINHHYSKYEGGYENWYAACTIQGLLNMINAKDKEGIISKFCKETKDNNDMSRQIDILFDYFDGEILDFENESSGGGGQSVEYGHYHNYEIWPNADAKTAKHTYGIGMSVVLMNDDEDKVGIEYIEVVRQDIRDWYIMRSWFIEMPSVEGRAIVCIDKKGIIT